MKEANNFQSEMTFSFTPRVRRQLAVLRNEERTLYELVVSAQLILQDTYDEAIRSGLRLVSHPKKCTWVTVNQLRLCLIFDGKVCKIDGYIFVNHIF